MDMLMAPVVSAWQRTLALRIITDQGFRGEWQPQCNCGYTGVKLSRASLHSPSCCL